MGGGEGAVEGEFGLGDATEVDVLRDEELVEELQGEVGRGVGEVERLGA